MKQNTNILIRVCALASTETSKTKKQQQRQQIENGAQQYISFNTIQNYWNGMNISLWHFGAKFRYLQQM